MATIQAGERWIDNGNGHLLSSYWYPPSGAPRGAVLIASAMGVKQRFYAAFASWLADRGYLVVTFDYLGMGRSRQIPLRQLKVDILDWARHDCSAVLATVAEEAGALPLYWIGHSVGAQILRERILEHAVGHEVAVVGPARTARRQARVGQRLQPDRGDRPLELGQLRLASDASGELGEVGPNGRSIRRAPAHVPTREEGEELRAMAPVLDDRPGQYRSDRAAARRQSVRPSQARCSRKRWKR